MKKPELLAPAGDWEKLKYALAYGADAVYLGGQDFGLRAYAGNFSLDEIDKAVHYTHDLGKKIYVTVNIVAHESDLDRLPAYLKDLEQMNIDGAIISDPGIIMMVQELAPKLPLHLSTQANCTNSQSIRFWQKQGIERVVLARELTLEELREVRLKVNGGLEIFIHGAMCMSYSGRCMLSNYLTGRDANRGECTQPCRWGYALVEEKRPGEVFPIEEDDRGTYIFNSHDLCLLSHLPLLRPIDIDSFKIEGRMKSVLYVASTVKVYREAIDTLWDEGEAAFLKKLPLWQEEMDKVSHRDYSAGFLFGKPDASSHNLVSSHYVRDYDFIGLHLNKEELKTESGFLGEDVVWIEQRNHFKRGEVLEVLTPQGMAKTFVVNEMWNIKGESIEVARHAQQKICLKVPMKIEEFSIFRRAKTLENSQD